MCRYLRIYKAHLQIPAPEWNRMSQAKGTFIWSNTKCRMLENHAMQVEKGSQNPVKFESILDMDSGQNEARKSGQPVECTVRRNA